MKLQEILDYLNISQNCDIEISGLNGLKDATSNELSFLESSKYISSLKDTKAAAVFVNKEFEQDVADYPLLKRGKRHDFFTACLPWPQKGTAVPLPLGLTAPIVGTGPVYFASSSPTGAVYPVYRSNTTYGNYTAGVTGTGEQMYWSQSASATGLVADLTNATAATVNAIRTAFQGQMYLELDARGGTRYTELIRSHFGVISPDSRLQRPEFLGSGSFPININQVPNTTGTAGAPQGTIAAYALAGGTAGGFTHSFTEHGMIIGLAVS